MFCNCRAILLPEGLLKHPSPPLPSVSVNIQWCCTASWKLIAECQSVWLLAKRSHHWAPKAPSRIDFNVTRLPTCGQSRVCHVRKLRTTDMSRRLSVLISTRIIKSKKFFFFFLDFMSLTVLENFNFVFWELMVIRINNFTVDSKQFLRIVHSLTNALFIKLGKV